MMVSPTGIFSLWANFEIMGHHPMVYQFHNGHPCQCTQATMHMDVGHVLTNAWYLGCRHRAQLALFHRRYAIPIHSEVETQVVLSDVVELVLHPIRMVAVAHEFSIQADRSSSDSQETSKRNSTTTIIGIYVFKRLLQCR